MKRLLPILGIFLITTLLGCSQNSQREKEKPLEEKNTLSSDVNAEPFTFYSLTQYVDDFENSTTWKLGIFSKNKMLYDSPILNTSPVLKWKIEKEKDYKKRAELKLTCKKYLDNYKSREYELTLESIKTYTVIKLKNICKKHKLKRYSRLKKQELINYINKELINT